MFELFYLYFRFILFSIFFLLPVFWRFFEGKRKSNFFSLRLRNLPLLVEYEPPLNLSPVEMGFLINRKVVSEDIAATIVNLAVKGYLKLEFEKRKNNFLKKIFSPSPKFWIIKLKNGFDLSGPIERKVFRSLFQKGDRISSTSFQRRSPKTLNLRDMYLEMQEILKEKGYIKRKITFFMGRKVPYSITIILFLLIFFSAVYFNLFFLSFLLFLDYKLSKEGISALNKVRGFKHFLELTEKEKLDLLNAPDMKPETFEKFLPYAIALGVEKKWAEQFTSIYNSSPQWYNGDGNFEFSIFLSNINAVRTTASLSLMNASGLINSGLVGFSGGGSGGGGGSSW